MFEEISRTLCCVLMLCVLSCQVVFELCFSLNLWPILIPLYCYELVTNVWCYHMLYSVLWSLLLCFCRWLQRRRLLHIVLKKGGKWTILSSALPNIERYNQFYEKAPIIQERFMDLVDLKDYFILGCFQDRG